MTRIYTNIPAMTARTNLNRNMASLETSLQRLSTGFKINSGKDDPAGLIASEILRSDMKGIEVAIKNTERANSMIATADSALNEITNLLNDIRGLVTEAANTGAMSAEMIAANQLQVDASLMAIDRIAAQTTFMGQKLLDGSLDFDKTGVDRNTLLNVSVNQVTFGSDKSPMDVNITVQSGADKAALYYNNPAVSEDINLVWGGNYGYDHQTFKRGATVSDIAKAVNASSNSTGVTATVGSDALQGTIYTSSLGQDNDIIITAGKAGTAAGNVEIKYLKGTSDGVRVEYEEPISDDAPAKLLVYLQTEENKSAVAKEVDTSPGINDNNALKFTANIMGSQYNDANIQFVDARLTQKEWGEKSDGTTKNPSETSFGNYAYYNDNATQSKALFGDVNDLGTFSTSLGTDEFFTVQAKGAGSQHNDTEIIFVQAGAGEVPAGRGAVARYSETTDDKTGEITKKQLRIAVDTASDATFQQVKEAIALEGKFEFIESDASILSKDVLAADLNAGEEFDPEDPDNVPPGYGNTQNSGGDAGTLFIAIDSADPPQANDIVAMFDINNPASKGSERVASLFTVERTADNDGTGYIGLYSVMDDVGVPVDPHIDPTTSFNKVFKDGQDSDKVITTAAELVTALNNSAYWGMSMCPEMLAELAEYNKNGTYFDATNPPVITARLAPGNRGLFPVSTFEEVAYYGDPNEGTALQFLGEENSPNIRFVAEPGNSELWIDRTTVPDKVDYSQAVLTATHPNASMIIRANSKGEQLDDVQFVYKRIHEISDDTDPDALDRHDGWVEYDPGVSYAETQATFKDAQGNDIADSAFFVKATERGDMFNDVKVVMTAALEQEEPVKVLYDETTKQLRVSLYSGFIQDPAVTGGTYSQINVNDVIQAINKADVGFEATLSYSQDAIGHINDGTGTFDGLGLRNGQLTEIANTGQTGGHQNGTVTVWMTDQPDADAASGYRQPNAADAARLINSDQVVGAMFNAQTYSSGGEAGTGAIDFVKDGPIVSTGGLVEKGAITVHLVTDEKGLIQTTAKDLAAWWQMQDPETVDHISASIVRPPGAVWDECNDPYGNGLLKPTVEIGECDELIVNDIQFVGWNDDVQKQTYVAERAMGTMTSDNGENSSYDLVARRYGPEYNGYTIAYVDNPAVSGLFADNYVEGSDSNPCDSDEWTGLGDDGCGNPILPQSYTNKGMFLELDQANKTITINVRAGITTAYDIEQLIESDPFTKNLFEVNQKGDGSGVISMQDNTLLTTGGSLPPGELNGAKLLFGSEASEYFLVFNSLEYGSDQFVDVQANGLDGTKTTFKLNTADGKVAEKVYGKDVEAMINGVMAVGNGLNASLNTATLAMDLTFSEETGTNTNFATGFSITGGGATYQIGPDVVSNHQITLGIPSVNTTQLGGASGKLYQLMSGQDASLTTDTNKAFRIVEESIVAVTSIRGRFGTIQKATFETNINVLGDTLEALTEAESQIRDTDFAEETSKLTRAQILVQSNISTLGIANQIPNYMLGLISR